MTLITYPTRVHFADDVMQEALHSELERAGCKAPLLIYGDDLLESDFAYRVQEGLPHKTAVQSMVFDAASDLRHLSRTAIDTGTPPDVLIAFGSARAIELARKCRYGLSQATGHRTPMYAIPGVDGLPGPCTRNLESWRAGLPSVLICDPTLTLNADCGQSWRSSVLSLVRCVESYLAQSFNPPADGMALDGLGRSLGTLPRIGDAGQRAQDLDLRRDMMAASLNASLSQEKGVGPALTLADALAHEQAGLQVPDMARLLLPEIIRRSSVNSERAEMLLKVLGRDAQRLDEAMTEVLARAPMAARLSDMGVAQSTLDQAASQAQGKAGLTLDTARDVLSSVY
ncbi:iron-containing alcohol dehydrogenase [uncultured Roseobacter sp.]|uniref:iron-containing alcohol dehydrogenase n=1 Tax=uncultured Roseobacter sp. TaxID=114847 RepID=UPI00262F323A|nr:iron-containing alcohol dehydrogenase [uncultured Roseobacter sp.]